MNEDRLRLRYFGVLVHIVWNQYIWAVRCLANFWVFIKRELFQTFEIPKQLIIGFFAITFLTKNLYLWTLSLNCYSSYIFRHIKTKLDQKLLWVFLHKNHALLSDSMIFGILTAFQAWKFYWCLWFKIFWEIRYIS